MRSTRSVPETRAIWPCSSSNHSQGSFFVFYYAGEHPADVDGVCGHASGAWSWTKLSRRGHHQAIGVLHGTRSFVLQDDDGQILGYITTRIDRQAGIGHIPNLSVRAAARGQGIGRQLIARALELFRQEGLELAKIETLDQNPVGQHLYPQCGFVEVARQIHFVMRL